MQQSQLFLLVFRIDLKDTRNRFKKEITERENEFKIRSKLVSALGASVLFFGITTSAMAISLGFGFSGGGTHVEVDGTETMNTSGTKSTDTGYGTAPLGSAYGQITVGESYFGDGNGFTLGYERFLGDATLDGKKSNGDRTDLIKGNVTNSGRNHAEAKIENFDQIYLETPGFTRLGIYLKAGRSGMDVITQEVLFTGGKYGDTSVDGDTYGFGFKKSANGFQVKTEFNYTDWESITLTNTGASEAAGAEKIVAAPENWSFKFSVGYNF